MRQEPVSLASGSLRLVILSYDKILQTFCLFTLAKNQSLPIVKISVNGSGPMMNATMKASCSGSLLL